MSNVKWIFAVFVAMIVSLTIWGLLQRGDSTEVALVKSACGVVKSEDGSWGLKSLLEVFPDFRQDEIDGKSGAIYQDVLAYLGSQSSDASGAAQLNGKWRPLADATVEYVYNIQMLYLIAEQGGINGEQYAEASRLSFKSLMRKGSECQAFINRLNS